jgi:hypothetical protein
MSAAMRVLVSILLLTLAAAGADAPATLYSNDFAKAATGKPPDEEFLVLAGEFAVTDAGGERFLELAGLPMESLGALFGPALDGPTGGVSARLWAAATGKRTPEFGVGLGDAGGYKLWLMPRQKRVAIRKGDQTLATAPYVGWNTDSWTRFRFEVIKAGEGAWSVRGKVWPDQASEPAEWTISFDETEEPAAGRASVWAHPYSGKPTRFDDLRLTNL